MRAKPLVAVAAVAMLAACLPAGPAEDTFSPQPRDTPPAVERCEASPITGSIGDAVAQIDLPWSTTVTSVAELPSANGTRPDAVDVVVSLCGEPLSDEDHRQFATDAAIAVSATSSADDIVDFTVHSYADSGNGLFTLERNLGVFDFQEHPWGDASSPVQLATVWGERAVP